jgi:hypothetical protein
MKTKILAYITISVLFVGCNDFLNQEPITEPLSAEYFANEENLITLISNAYQPMRWEFNGIYGDSYCMPYMYTDVRSDDVINENKYFQPHGHGFQDFVSQTSSNINVRLIWTKFYTGVANANEVIQGLVQVTDEQLPLERKQLYLAEARFLRAYYYFELVKNYGAVPLFGDEPVDLANPESVKRKPINEVYAQIENDLIEASTGLPPDQDYDYKATRGAALGLLAKVYLYQQKWQLAADAAQAVISLGKYSLEENYGDNWKIDNEFGKESLFEISYENDISGGNWGPTAKTSLSLQFFAPNFAPTPQLGWSYNLPTREFLDAFNNEGDAIRRDATIMQEGHIFNSPQLQDAGFDPLPTGYMDTWINSPESNGQRYGDDFYYSLKYYVTPEELEDYMPGLQQSTLNQKVMRYAEVLLILAEATLNGASGNGQAAFDEVRQRVNLPPKTLTYDALKLERRLELGTEWNRFHDLVRWGDAATVLGPNGFKSGRDELLPIPLADILLTGTDDSGAYLLEQNPGY